MEILVPDIATQASMSDFIQALIELNRNRRGVLSARRFSKWLKWPVSLIPEVLDGRRQLSAKRLAELAEFLKLSPQDCLNLLILNLLDNKEPQVTAFAQSIREQTLI